MTERTARRRRTPEEARSEILAAAEDRLRRHGVNGLNVVDVAKACGMSHATVIHHFGNTDGMRRALVAHMTDRLLRELITMMAQERQPEPAEVLRQLFTTLSRGGHAKLVAWLYVGGEYARYEGGEANSVVSLFDDILGPLASSLPQEDAEAQMKAARKIVYLVATAAIGYAVSAELLPHVIGLDADEAEHFPEWLSVQISRLMADVD